MALPFKRTTSRWSRVGRSQLCPRSRRRLRRFVVVTLIGVLTVAFPGVALANTSVSAWGYYGPYAGYSYKNQATANNPGPIANNTGTAEVDANPFSAGIPPYYAGTLPRTLDKYGSLCHQPSAYAVNYQWVNSMLSKVFGGCGPNQIFYAQGATEAWDGSSWHYVWTFKTGLILGGV